MKNNHLSISVAWQVICKAATRSHFTSLQILVQLLIEPIRF